MLTFGEIAEKRLKGKTFDFAIPNDVFNEILDTTGINPSGNIVWLYDEQAKIFGRPFGLTLLGYQLLKIMKWNNGGFYNEK